MRERDLDARSSCDTAAGDHQRGLASLLDEVAALTEELASLASAFDRWWYATPGGDESRDLHEGARLHQEIAACLGRLAAVQAALAGARRRPDGG